MRMPKPSSTMKVVSMAERYLYAVLFFIPLSLLSLYACQKAAPDDKVNIEKISEKAVYDSPLDRYVKQADPAFEYKVVDTLFEDDYTAYVVRMVSQRWLTKKEVKDPLWWHWLTIIVPDEVQHDKAMLLIGGGSRESEKPQQADESTVRIALETQSVVASLHNVPNQAIEFVGDDYGPRVEDELIAYGWRKFLEGGAKEEDAIWLARLPMTKAAVRALDVIEALSIDVAGDSIGKFVVAGGSKRGWTTWTTAAVDERVVGIAPIVIDLLNVVPSFEHHWQAYGAWAPAVGNYEEEEIMDWLGTKEFKKLLALTEPYSFKDRLDMPKLLLNATGDQFFLPDSWQFYWPDLRGEKHLRYVPNSEHSMQNTDYLETLTAFYADILTETPRPEFTWKEEEGTIVIRTDADHPPQSVKLWYVNNPDARDFRVDIIGRSWSSVEIPLQEEGEYRLSPPRDNQGYTAYYGELVFENGSKMPLKLSTGVLVTPNTYPHSPFEPKETKGTPIEE